MAVFVVLDITDEFFRGYALFLDFLMVAAETETSMANFLRTPENGANGSIGENALRYIFAKKAPTQGTLISFIKTFLFMCIMHLLEKLFTGHMVPLDSFCTVISSAPHYLISFFRKHPFTQ